MEIILEIHLPSPLVTPVANAVAADIGKADGEAVGMTVGTRKIVVAAKLRVGTILEPKLVVPIAETKRELVRVPPTLVVIMSLPDIVGTTYRRSTRPNRPQILHKHIYN